jgi:hypothetical protein
MTEFRANRHLAPAAADRKMFDTQLRKEVALHYRNPFPRLQYEFVLVNLSCAYLQPCAAMSRLVLARETFLKAGPRRQSTLQSSLWMTREETEFVRRNSRLASITEPQIGLMRTTLGHAAVNYLRNEA